MPQPGSTFGSGSVSSQRNHPDTFANFNWDQDTSEPLPQASTDSGPIFGNGEQLFFDTFSPSSSQQIVQPFRQPGSGTIHGAASPLSSAIGDEAQVIGRVRGQSSPRVERKGAAVPPNQSSRQKRAAPHDFEIFLPPSQDPSARPAATGSPRYQTSRARYSASTSPPQHASSQFPKAQPAYTQAQDHNLEIRNSSAAYDRSPASSRARPPFRSPAAPPPTAQNRREHNKSTPLARQMNLTGSTFQHNDEEEIRRFYLGQSVNRTESVVSDRSLHSVGAHEYTNPDRSEDASRFESSRLEAGLQASQVDLGHGPVPGVARSSEDGNRQTDDEGPLPLGKGFTIHVGSEIFKLSGASIMSDAPSYFSRFFADQLKESSEAPLDARPLFIDRDPETFRDICRHLQGYVIQPRDASHYVRLFVDAQLFSLPRLTSLLFDSETFISIGGENFTLPRDLFSSFGNTPNYFSLGFAAFFSSPDEPFPGLDTKGLLRPPPVKPPNVPSRSAKVFADILHMLRGYPMTVRDENHRAELLRDCRYFNLRGLEQRIIAHHISYNASRSTSEIVIRLEDIRQSGISYVEDVSPSSISPLGGWIYYARPFVDLEETSHELILQIDDEAAKLDFRSMRIEFYDMTKARISKLFQVIANKMNLPVNVPLGLMMATGGAASQEVSPGNTPLSEDRVKVHLGQDSHIILDGEDYIPEHNLSELHSRYEEDYNHGASSPNIDRNSVVSAPTSTTTTSAPSIWPPSLMPPGQPRGISPASAQPPPRKRRRRGSLDEFGEWVVKKGQWRLKVRPRPDGSRPIHHEIPNGNDAIFDKMEIVLHAVKLEAFTGQRGRNMQRGFLP